MSLAIVYPLWSSMRITITHTTHRWMKEKKNDFLLPDKSCIENRILNQNGAITKNLPEKSSGWCLQEAKTSDTIECNPIHFDSNNNNNHWNNMHTPRQIKSHCAIDCTACVHGTYQICMENIKNRWLLNKRAAARRTLPFLFVLGAIGLNKRHLTFYRRWFSFFTTHSNANSNNNEMKKNQLKLFLELFYVDIFTYEHFCLSPYSFSRVELQMNFIDFFLCFVQISGLFSLPTDGSKWH